MGLIINVKGFLAGERIKYLVTAKGIDVHIFAQMMQMCDCETFGVYTRLKCAGV